MPETFDNGWINTNTDRSKWIRVDPDVGGLYCYNPESEQYDILLPLPINAVTGLVDILNGKAATGHTHEGLDQLPNIITLLNNGVTGSKTVGGFTITVNHGIITGFEEV